MAMNKQGMNIGVVIAIVVAMIVATNIFNHSGEQSRSGHHELQEQALVRDSRSDDDTDKIRQAFTQQRNDVQVQASGRVKSILPDDNKGSRHQRFILELGTGQTILVAHNIDLAPRIENIQKGDVVEFYGVYEYNPQGGVVHWTHHDPKGQHIGGWLKHQGQTYE